MKTLSWFWEMTVLQCGLFWSATAREVDMASWRILKASIGLSVLLPSARPLGNVTLMRIQRSWNSLSGRPVLGASAELKRRLDRSTGVGHGRTRHLGIRWDYMTTMTCWMTWTLRMSPRCHYDIRVMILFDFGWHLSALRRSPWKDVSVSGRDFMFVHVAASSKDDLPCLM